jgi:alginate O-acetyltransferase complex protein AlgI
MLFNSYQFLLFFPIVTLLYFFIPHKFRWLHLLIASCVFYMAFIPIYILILILTIVIDYIAGILIENAEGQRRKMYLGMSIVANVGVLSLFKYFNFFADNVNHIFHWTHVNANIPFLQIILPIGLSFHTFQAMSYTIEVYRGNQKTERHFGIYALYVMFYPQLVAGPIERPQNMLHQFHEKHTFEYRDVVAGLRMMLWGMFKKVVIADRLALVTDPIFNSPHSYSGLAIGIGTVFFAIQIFCDFSGYSNIALGAARVMGFRLMTNFNRPYSAKSISEFWRRWHISLSTWFNDYFFTPLTVSWRNYGLAAIGFAAVLTFLTSGLWHGANWTFIVWGGLHGLAIAYEVVTKKRRKKLFKKLPVKLGENFSRGLTFSYACVCYIFFRANTLSDAVYMVRKLPSAFTDIITILKTGWASIHLPLSGAKMLLCVAVILLLELVHKIQDRVVLNNFLQAQPRYKRWAIYYVFALMIIYLGVFQNRQFIYFQF